MNIIEIYNLGLWFKEHGEIAEQFYRSLSSEQIRQLRSFDDDGQNTFFKPLEKIPTEKLSLQQIEILKTLDVYRFVGFEGSKLIKETISLNSNNVGGLSSHFGRHADSLRQAHQKLYSLYKSIDELGLQTDLLGASNKKPTVRVIFKSNSSINNIKDWKDQSKLWHDTIRGITLSIDEAPEEVKVIGASTGSLILILTGTAVFTGLLASIMKDITSVAKNTIAVKIAWEDYKQKAMVTDEMKSQHNTLIENQEKEGKKKVIEGIIEQLPQDINGEQKNALENSIDNIFEFTENGGDLDFVGALTNDPENGELDKKFNDARNSIKEFQKERNTMLLLENPVGGEK
jgi:hypothetical protein